MRTKNSYKCTHCQQWVLFAARREHPCAAPQTDLQERVAYIERELDALKTDSSTAEVQRLAGLVSYLAAIVFRHLRDGES